MLQKVLLFVFMGVLKLKHYAQVGLLPVCNHQQLPFAWDMYKREDKQGLDLSHDFKKTYCRSVSVDFLGVWYGYSALNTH